MTLKCDQQNSTFLHSTSIKKRQSSINKENGSKLLPNHGMHSVGVSEFQLKPQNNVAGDNNRIWETIVEKSPSSHGVEDLQLMCTEDF